MTLAVLLLSVLASEILLSDCALSEVANERKHQFLRSEEVGHRRYGGDLGEISAGVLAAAAVEPEPLDCATIQVEYQCLQAGNFGHECYWHKNSCVMMDFSSKASWVALPSLIGSCAWRKQVSCARYHHVAILIMAWAVALGMLLAIAVCLSLVHVASADGPAQPRVPPWQRFGVGRAELDDGRIIWSGGQFGDTDNSFVFNDICVQRVGGAADTPYSNYEFLKYDKTEFPPTDYHASVQAGPFLYFIGNKDRHAMSMTVQVLRLDLQTYNMEKVETTGNVPPPLQAQKIRPFLDAPRSLVVGMELVFDTTDRKYTVVFNGELFGILVTAGRFDNELVRAQDAIPTADMEITATNLVRLNEEYAVIYQQNIPLEIGMSLEPSEDEGGVRVMKEQRFIGTLEPVGRIDRTMGIPYPKQTDRTTWDQLQALKLDRYHTVGESTLRGFSVFCIARPLHPLVKEQDSGERVFDAGDDHAELWQDASLHGRDIVVSLYSDTFGAKAGRWALNVDSHMWRRL